MQLGLYVLETIYLFSQEFILLRQNVCSTLRYVCCSSDGKTGRGRLQVPTGDVGSFGSWGCVILGCIDVWLLQLPCSSLTS